MNARTPTSALEGLRQSLRAAPGPLLAYAAFVVMVVVAEFVVLPFAPEPFRAGLVQYTGWVASSAYGFTVVFAFVLIFQRQRRGTIRFFGITFQLFLQIGYGLLLLTEHGRPNFGNPYLTVSAYRPIWTIVIPAIWLVLLHTPGMNRFCHQKPQLPPARMTAIEQALFRNGSAHCVSAFELSAEALLLTLHPWESEQVLTQARFEKPFIVSTDDSHAQGDRELPWDIIGFESEPKPEGGWRFCLHTDSLEFVFDSDWPQISKAG